MKRISLYVICSFLIIYAFLLVMCGELPTNPKDDPDNVKATFFSKSSSEIYYQDQPVEIGIIILYPALTKRIRIAFGDNLPNDTLYCDPKQSGNYDTVKTTRTFSDSGKKDINVDVDLVNGSVKQFLYKIRITTKQLTVTFDTLAPNHTIETGKPDTMIFVASTIPAGGAIEFTAESQPALDLSSLKIFDLGSKAMVITTAPYDTTYNISVTAKSGTTAKSTSVKLKAEAKLILHETSSVTVMSSGTSDTLVFTIRAKESDTVKNMKLINTSDLKAGEMTQVVTGKDTLSFIFTPADIKSYVFSIEVTLNNKKDTLFYNISVAKETSSLFKQDTVTISVTEGVALNFSLLSYMTDTTVQLNADKGTISGKKLVYSASVGSVRDTVIVTAQKNSNMSRLKIYININKSDKPKFTVTYLGNGSTEGTVPVDSVNYEAGASVTIAAAGTLVKTGSTFIGWNTKADGSGINYNAGSKLLISSTSTILYAKWTTQPVSLVIYNRNGADSGSVPAGGNYEVGALVTVSDNTGKLAKAGVAFSGWNTMQNGTGTNYAPGATFIKGSTNDTLYVKWSSFFYTVTYDGQGATTAPSPVSQTVTSPATTVGTLPTHPQKTGFSFGGWYTAINGGGTEFSAATTVTANDTVYAKWTQNVTFILTVSATNGSVTKVPDLTAYESGTVVTLTPVPANGYHFTGWSGALTGMANPGTITMNEAKSITAGFEKNAVNSFTLTVLASNGTVKKTPDLPQYDSISSVGLKATPSAGYSFVCWTGDATGTTDSITVLMTSAKNVTANFALNTFVLTMSNDGHGTTTPTTGTPTTVNQVDATAITATPSAGYQFSSWAVTTGTATVANPASATTTVTLSTNATIKANFSPITLSLTMASDGHGTTTPIPGMPTTVNQVDATAITATPLAGYQFSNWAVTTGTATVANPASATTTVTLSTNATIKANFSPITLSLTMSNDGHGTTNPTTGTTTVNQVDATAITATPSAGYKFSSWVVTTGTAVVANPTSASTTVTLSTNATIRANFSLITFSLTMSNDGNGTTTPPTGTTTVNQVDATAITATPSSGYQFSSWAVTTGTAIVATPSSATTTVTLSTNATIKANFAMNPPVITPLTPQTCPVNDNVTFTVVATGTGLSYKWKKNGTEVGVTTPSYTTPPLTVADISAPVTYKCIVSNAGGKDSSSTTLSVATVSDYNTNLYHQVKIGTQVWMVENLRATSLNNGTPIVKEEVAGDWGQAGAPRYCYYDNSNESVFVRQYGALYNWYTINTGLLAPTGWRVPSVNDWNALVTFVGDNGGKLKEAGIANWIDPNEGATNETGFTALPGSLRYSAGGWGYPYLPGGGSLGYGASFWTGEESDVGNANCTVLIYSGTTITQMPFSKSCGLSVRCIKN